MATPTDSAAEGTLAQSQHQADLVSVQATDIIGYHQRQRQRHHASQSQNTAVTVLYVKQSLQRLKVEANKQQLFFTVVYR